MLLILFQDVGKNITLQSTIDITHLFFLAQISCCWFGCNNASKEIIKDRNMFRRERDFNLGVMSFYLSKLLEHKFDDAEELSIPYSIKISLIESIIDFYKIHLTFFKDIKSHHVLSEILK